MSTAADYIGRTFDVLALRGAERTGAVLLQQTLFDGTSSGEVCTGVQKLAQRWLLALMTIRGSMPYRPELGTDFMLTAKHGFQTETDVILSFNIAMVLVERQLQNEEDASWHDEDRYARAELISLTLTATTLSMQIRVWSRAGSAREVILPSQTTPTRTGV